MSHFDVVKVGGNIRLEGFVARQIETNGKLSPCFIENNISRATDFSVSLKVRGLPMSDRRFSSA